MTASALQSSSPPIDLAALVRERGPLPVDEAIRIARGIAAVLISSHRRGVVHHGVRPQSVLVSPNGEVRLAEVVLARPSGHTIAPAGQQDLVAPEVIAGQRWDARSDIYSLGMTLFFALTGELPSGQSPELPPFAQADGYRPGVMRPDLPQWLDDLVACATAALPGDRYSSAAAVLDALTARGPIPAASAPPSKTTEPRCLLCGEAEQTGIGLCNRCLEADAREPSALVFVRRSASRREPVPLEAAIRGLPSTVLDAAGIRAAARGQRALARVPVRYAGLVIDSLSRRNIPARVGGDWASLPGVFYGILGAMGASGTAAGVVLSPMLLWTTPLLVALMWLEAQRQMQVPLLKF